MQEGDVIAVYDNLLKLYSAAWLICQRDGGYPQLKRSKLENSLKEMAIAPIVTRTIFELTKLQGDLTAVRNEKQPVLTHSRVGEKASPFIPMDKTLKS